MISTYLIIIIIIIIFIQMMDITGTRTIVVNGSSRIVKATKSEDFHIQNN